MKKIFKLLIVFILFIFIISIQSCKQCGEEEIVIEYYKEETKQKFVDKFYTIINDEDIKYVACDLRTKELYETEHVRQFQNYDLSKGDYNSLLTWLNNNYSKEHQIVIFSEDTIDSSFVELLKDTYQIIYIYEGTYQNIRINFEESFILESGPYDCGC